MVNRPSVPEIITVNSEDLQAQIRDLLPSQNGFGSELQASNVITPIIDLTATAEGSILRADLQSALAFGSQTVFNANNAAVNLAASPGFWLVTYVSTLGVGTSGAVQNRFTITDGSSTKNIWRHRAGPVSSLQFSTVDGHLVFFLAPGETLAAETDSAVNNLSGSYRQIATGDGTFVNPNGFPL